MGAGASVEDGDITSTVRGLGSKYEADAKALEANAVTWQMLNEFKDEGTLNELFSELGIESKVRCKRLAHLLDERVSTAAEDTVAPRKLGVAASGAAASGTAASGAAASGAAASGAAAGVTDAARRAAAAVGPLVEALARGFDASAVATALATLGGAFASVSKCTVPPISLVLSPLGEAVGAVVKRAELVRANKDACEGLAAAVLIAVRTLFESLALADADDLARGDGAGVRLAPAIERMHATFQQAEELIGRFAGKGFVRRMISANVDAHAFERVEKDLHAELADVAAAVGRETLDLQRRTYEKIDELARLIESQRGALKAHQPEALAQLRACAGIDKDVFEEEMRELGVKVDELSGKVDAIARALEAKSKVERTHAYRDSLADSLEVQFERVQFLDDLAIAQGSDGAIYRVRFEGEVMCAKVIDLSRVPLSEFTRLVMGFKKEVALMASVHSSKVVSVRGCCTTALGQNPFILMEFAHVGSLRDVLDRGDVPPALVLKLLLDAAYGMQALAARGIVHRDLKSAQILVFGGPLWSSMHAKVGDFGRARGKNVNATATATASAGFIGSYPWGAPESLENDIYTAASDVYSYGCVVSECLTGKIPFDSFAVIQIALAVIKGKRPTLPEPETVQPFMQPLLGLCERCWLTDPALRPSFGDIVTMLEKSFDLAPPLDDSGAQATIKLDGRIREAERDAQARAEAERDAMASISDDLDSGGEERCACLIRQLDDAVGADGESALAVTDEGIALLESLGPGPVVVIAVAGVYRTGKSFFLNRMAGSAASPSADGDPAARRFAVGRTSDPCTRGIWLRHVPALRARAADGAHVLLMDSEGLASCDQTETYDAKIFGLALLLSSYFVLNIVGVLDELTLDRLHLVTELSKRIAVAATTGGDTAAGGGGEGEGGGDDGGGGGDATAAESALAEHFPPLLFLLRDFALEMSKDGVALSEPEYLEDSLRNRADGSGKPNVRQKLHDEVRRSLRALFPPGRRFLATLARPVSDEAQLREAVTLKDEEVRRVLWR